MIDMAGYNDEGRAAVGVLGVSYMLKRVLERVREVKFVLVIPHARMILNQVAEIIKSFENFINMLQVSNFMKNPIIKEEFFKSVSLVITRAEKERKFYEGKINKVIKNLD